MKKKNKSKERNKSVKQKIPKTAAMAIKGSSKDFSYADALKKARMEISLEDLEISMPKIRKGMNNATIIEIIGVDHDKKVDELANKSLVRIKRSSCN